MMRGAQAGQSAASSFSIPHDHPSLDGHFPGNPIVPGVVLLDYAISVLLPEDSAEMLSGIKGAKFHAPVRAGDLIEVHATRASPAGLLFQCTRDGEIVAAGIFILADSSEPRE